MPQPIAAISYNELVALFAAQLTIGIHTILSARKVYPEASFIRARAYNLPVMQSRHPGVCTWINDAVAAVEAELLRGAVARVALVIFEAAWNDTATDQSNEQSASNTTKSTRGHTARALERYVWDVSRWPQVPKSEHHTTLGRSSLSEDEGLNAEPEVIPDEKRLAFQANLKKAHSDMQEQFRGLLSRLTTISGTLKPLPEDAECTFSLSIELLEDADAPIGHPQPWIPSEPASQRRIVHAQSGADGNPQPAPGEGTGGGRSIHKGAALGGQKVTPVRAVDAGEMLFEMWIEESSAKFEAGAS